MKKTIIASILALCAVLALAVPAQAAVVTPTIVYFGSIDPELEAIVNDSNPYMAQGFTGNLISQVGEKKAAQLKSSLGASVPLDPTGWLGYLDTVYGLSYRDPDFWQQIKKGEWYEYSDRLGSKWNPFSPSDLNKRIPIDITEVRDFAGSYVRLGDVTELYKIDGLLLYNANPNYPDRWVLYLNAVDSKTTPAKHVLTWPKQ